MIRQIFVLSLLVVLCCTASCSNSTSYIEETPPLASINIIDRNGFTETISSQERLNQYEKVDFLTDQPYQKVLRIFARDQQGNIRAFITSYHPNGHPKQYLEVVNNRAYGAYREWHANGQIKLDTTVLGGEADIDTSSEKTWLFSGISYAWNECGTLLAEISYCNGKLEGNSIYYHANGTIWKKVLCRDGKFEGMTSIYLDNGVLLQTIEYCNGLKHGSSIRYWDVNFVAAEETYSKGYLASGEYFTRNGEKISEIDNGNGIRVLFSKESISEMHEYRNGIQEGEIKIFDSNGILVSLHKVKDGLKDGEEIEYYEPECDTDRLIPKISISWSEGKIHGLVKTWYPTEIMESQREMSNNVKNGVLTAWYADGSIMLIEQYDHNKLVKGEYYISGERMPVSEVWNGNGTATLFDNKGNLLQKITYTNGRPFECN